MVETSDNYMINKLSHIDSGSKKNTSEARLYSVFFHFAMDIVFDYYRISLLHHWIAIRKILF